MKQKLHKISMAAVAVVVFAAALSLNLEKNGSGSWEFAVVKRVEGVIVEANR